VEFEELIEQNK